MIIPKLTSKITGDVLLQVTNAAASIHQMRWADAHQQLEHSLPEGRSPITYVEKFLAIPSTGDRGKTPIETVRVVTT